MFVNILRNHRNTKILVNGGSNANESLKVGGRLDEYDLHTREELAALKIIYYLQYNLCIHTEADLNEKTI